MSDSGFPSMTALLGLLAVAGFQNRDKIAEMLGGAGQGGGTAGSIGQGNMGQGSMAAPSLAPGSQPGGMAGGLGGLLGGLTGAGAGGGFLSGGLSQLVNQFQQNGHGPVAQSWVNAGPNQAIAPQHLEQAIGPDVLSTLTQKTGLSREELLSRLSKELPDAVDRYTPDGRLPA